MKRKIGVALSLAALGAALWVLWSPREGGERRAPASGSLRDGRRGNSLADPAAVDTGRLETSSTRASSGAPLAPDFPDTEEGRRLRAHWVAMDAQGPEAESEYQRSLAELKRDAKRNIQALAQTYQAAPAEKFADRWKMVSTIAALQDESGVEPLIMVAEQAIPSEGRPGSDGLGTRGEERAIRIAAIDGLAALAKAGNRPADLALLEFATADSSPTQRRRAIRGYLGSGGNYEERARVLQARLPASLHAMISLDVTPPEKALQGLELDAEVTSASATANPLQSLRRALGAALIPSAGATSCYDPVTAEDLEAKPGAVYVDLPAIYESHYRPAAWCRKDVFAGMWKDFKFENKYWNAEAGFEDPCSLDFPLGRTMNALWALRNSVSDPISELTDRKGNLLRWAYGYAATVTSHFRIVCDGVGPRAVAFFSRTDNTMNVTWGWAMATDIVDRAGIIVHESRHYKKPHVSPEPACLRPMSCDPDWAYNGANTFQASWYWEFYLSAVNTTSAHKDRAKVLGQMVLDEGFNEPPGFTIY